MVCGNDERMSLKKPKALSISPIQGTVPRWEELYASNFGGRLSSGVGRQGFFGLSRTTRLCHGLEPITCYRLHKAATGDPLDPLDSLFIVSFSAKGFLGKAHLRTLRIPRKNNGCMDWDALCSSTSPSQPLSPFPPFLFQTRPKLARQARGQGAEDLDPRYSVRSNPVNGATGHVGRLHPPKSRCSAAMYVRTTEHRVKVQIYARPPGRAHPYDDSAVTVTVSPAAVEAKLLQLPGTEFPPSSPTYRVPVLAELTHVVRYLVHIHMHIYLSLIHI